MSTLLNEITEHFMTSKMGARNIDGYDGDNLSITIKMQDYYGVGILNVNNIDVNESFANAKLESKVYEYKGKEQSFLVLSSTLTELKTLFAHTCTQFISLGEESFNRKSIVEDPYGWWEKWKELLGNVKSNKQPYAVLGELWLYKKELISNHPNVSWQGPSAKHHDIEGDLYHVEVKTSLQQFQNTVVISSHFQLDGIIPLYLTFLKVQESNDGVSINQLVKEIVDLGVDRQEIELSLGAVGMMLGSAIRDKKYRIIEARKYLVGDDFPKIDATSFVGGQIPKHIKKISYTVDLSSFDYDTIEID